MLYELVNPSDPYVFQADSFPVAVVTAWLISPMYAAKPEAATRRGSRCPQPN